MTVTSNRIQGVQEYYFSKKLREVAVLNSQGADIINLGIGSPDLMPPKSAVDALIDASMVENSHGYQSYKGSDELRDAFASFYKRYYNLDIDPATQVLPLLGSKEGITYISQSFLNEGDEVLVPNPGYPAYAAATKIAGGVVKYYDLVENTEWLPDIEVLDNLNLEKVKLMWINYPHMPTGAKASVEKLEAMTRFAKQHNILLINDNPYSFILNDDHLSIFSATGGINEHVLELNSLSKSHNMAGWRVGMLIGVEKYINNVLISKSNVDSGMFLPVQKATIEALKEGEDWFAQLNIIYENRRKVVWQIMDELNCSYDKNASGLFVWGKVPRKITDTEKFIDAILYKAKVFITPGTIFGSNGKDFIRISLCAKNEQLQKALKRIKDFNKINKIQ